MSRIFISYRKKDIDLCRALVTRLRDEKHEVWWDDSLVPGKDFVESIERELRAADVVIVLWTRQSVRSKWVYFETLMASYMEKLVPLKIGACDIPYGLQNLHTYDYDPAGPRDGENWQSILRRIPEAELRGKTAQQPVTSLDELPWRKIRTSRDVQDFRDFDARYPESRFIDEAKEKLREREQAQRRTNTLWWSGGLLIYLALALPFITLQFDYSHPVSLLMAMLYFPFFCFFAVFGLMMVPIYCFSYVKALRYGFAQGFGFATGSLSARIASTLVLIVVPVAACAIVAVVETSDGYGPWQYSEQILDTPLRQLAQGVPGIERVKGTPDILTDSRTLLNIFETTRDIDVDALWQSRNDTAGARVCNAAPPGWVRADAGPDLRERAIECLRHMNNLQRVMEHVRQDPATRSITSYAYQWGFFFFALTFLGTYFNIIFLSYNSERVRYWMARLSPWSGQRYSQLLHLFGVQLLFISIWFVSRMLFQLETETILPSSGGAEFSQAIRNSYFFFLTVFLICVGFVIRAAFRMNDTPTRIGIVLLAGLTATFIGLAFSKTLFVRHLQSFIGVHANVQTTIMLLILAFFTIFVPLVLPNLFPRREEELAPVIDDPILKDR